MYLSPPDIVPETSPLTLGLEKKINWNRNAGRPVRCTCLPGARRARHRQAQTRELLPLRDAATRLRYIGVAPPVPSDEPSIRLHAGDEVVGGISRVLGIAGVVETEEVDT